MMAFDVLAEYATGANPTDLTLAPMNAGGQLDLVLANNSVSQGSVRLGNADGTFNSPKSTGVTATSVATGDLTGDGITDLVSIGSVVLVQKGKGDGTFEAPQSISLPAQVAPGNPDPSALPQTLRSVVVGDLNRDGKLDLVVGGQTAWSEYYRTLVCNYYYCTYAGSWRTYVDGYVNVLMGNGSGGFAAPVVKPLGRRSPDAIAINDLNNDGQADVLAAGTAGLSALIGDGKGAFAAPVHSESWTILKSISLGDIDGDGRLDALTGWGDWLTVHKGQGNGSFTALPAIGVNHSVDSAVIGDVNGDGRLDLVAAGTQYTCNSHGYYGCYDVDYVGKASVLLGNGAGGFSLPIHSSLGITFDGAFVDVALANLTGDHLPELVTIENSTGRAIIASNDGDWIHPVNLSISSATVREGNLGTVNAVFTVTLASPSSAEVTVDYATADLSGNDVYWYGGLPATAGVDYTARTGTLTIPAGQTTGFISVPVIGDRLGEETELFFLTLSNPTHANLTNSRGVATITDDEPTVSFEYESTPGVVEGNSGTKPMTFTVELSAPSDVSVTVDYVTSAGSADWSSDFQPVAGTLTFAPGQMTKAITVQILGDTRTEEDEYFHVHLENATNAKLGSATQTGYIIDDDTIPSISISDAALYEGNSGTKLMTFTVTLSQASNKQVRVNYATANGTAQTGGGDYVAKSGTITFKPGETSKSVTISIKGDRKYESDEYFFVNLSGASGAPIEDRQAKGWIYNDDGTSTKLQSSSMAKAHDAALTELLAGNSRKRRR